MDTSHEDLNTTAILYRWILLRMRNVWDDMCRENQSTHFKFNKLFSENRAVYDIMWKNMVELGRSQVTTWRMRLACRITMARTQTHTLIVFNTCCFSTATMVKRTRLDVTFYAHCLVSSAQSRTENDRHWKYIWRTNIYRKLKLTNTNDINTNKMQRWRFISNSNQLNMFRTMITPIFRSTRLRVTACGIMHPRCCRPVAWKRRHWLCLRFQATARQHRGCIIPQAVTHSLVLLRMGKIIARNMLSWLELLRSWYCCI